MKVEIITCMYNEEFLAPFFLSHYGWVDKITVLFGTDSTDKTESILKGGNKVNIIPFTMPQGMDDELKSEMITEAYKKSTAGWVLIADADEFMFIDKTDLEKLGKEHEAARVALHHVYRHVTESDLDPAKPIREQRQHGYLSAEYIKPSIVKTGLNIFWGPGHHGIVGEISGCNKIFPGAHWANADPCFCVERRIKGRRDRQSIINIRNNRGHGNYNITEESILAECKEHENDNKINWEGERENKPNISFGVMVNDIIRLDMVLRQSEIEGEIHFIKEPESATKGLNKLLDIIEAEGAEIAVLTHQDVFFRRGWLDQVKEQIAKLPESWIVAGVVGKDMEGRIAGKFRDMRIPQHWNTSGIHEFPQSACCFDECCIIVNMKKGFRFDESMDGFDLYGTLCVLQTWEMGGTAWIIDAYAEHYCLRPFTWFPDEGFKKNYKWLYDKYNRLMRIDSTALGMPPGARFETSAAA